MAADDVVLRELASPYVWWKSPEHALERRSHWLYQLLQLGTAEDVRSARRILGDEALREALRCCRGVVRVASLLDLGGTKLKTLLQRVEAKDYRDVAALLERGVALAEILGAARALFATSFNPLVAQKALAYFEGGDLDTLSDDVRLRLTAEAEPRASETLVAWKCSLRRWPRLLSGGWVMLPELKTS